MTEKVYIRIKGLHLETQQSAEGTEEDIEIINVGKYKIVAGNEYIKYDEVFDDGGKAKTLMKISDMGVEISKKGAVTSHMSFIKGEKTRTLYETPYGNLYMGIYSKTVDISNTDDRINILIEYSIEINNQHVSDSRVEICIQSEAPEL